MNHDERRSRWDARYATGGQDIGGPNPLVAAALSDLAAGRAVDLGAGSGRHAIWLARQGWRVQAVDFSEVGIARGEQTARAEGLEIDWVVDDARTWAPTDAASLDLVLVSHLHLPVDVLARATGWLAAGGHLVVVAHSERNLNEGVGGPSDPALLYSPADLRAATGGLDILRLEELSRSTDSGRIIEAVLVARRPT